MRVRLGGIGRATARATIALSLLTGLAVGAPGQAMAAERPAVLRDLAAQTATGEWDDDEYQWYRQSLVDIAGYDSEPEVRTAAQAALDAGTIAAVKEFVDTGWAKARALVSQRKAKARNQVKDWAKNGGPKVKEWANRALAAGDYEIGEFVAWGHEMADRLDHPVGDAEAERTRIRDRVEQMVAFGGPTVMAEGMTALGSGDPAVIEEFYRTGYAAANRADWQNRESLRAAVEARNTALDELAAMARTATAAASARADILKANIDAMKLLDDSLVAMQLGVKASRRADQILEEDKPARKNGKLGRTADIEALKVETTTQAQRASAAATQADGVIATVQIAAAKLIKTGESHGVDWAKVTIAAGSAVQAAAASAETSQHAAEATLADSRALDADANAQLHAKNADKWLAAAKKQADTAKALADVAKQQQKVAEEAAARAKTQREAAEDAARRAGEHATQAQDARIAAQTASNNAIDKSNAAMAARSDALRAREPENRAISKAKSSAQEANSAKQRCIATEEDYKALAAALKKARDDATAAGKDADAATADIAAAADRARSAYEAAQGWAARAQAAADAARAEAEKTSVAANQARAAAIKADQDAVIARRASDKAESAARGALQAAETAALDAQRTQSEAEAAVQESSQAVFQAQIADQAAGAAAASAELAVDRADTADYIAAQFSAVNADARRIMQATAEAILISKERQAAAQKRADDAAAAADRATAAAEKAIGDIKPAYDAAAQAVSSARDASIAAAKAHNAAADAINQANGANAAAARASRYESSAWGEASLANSAARSASYAATMAGNAAADTDRLQTWATKSTDAIHTLATGLTDEFDKITAVLKGAEAEKAKQEAIARKQKEFEDNFKKGLLTTVRCFSENKSEECLKVDQFILDKGKQALDAGKDYLVAVARCHSTGEAEACKTAWNDTLNILDFGQQVQLGIIESTKEFFVGIKKMAECMSPVVMAIDGWDNCLTTLKQFAAMPKMLKEHPFELIHLAVWQDNPGKALGMTLFDVGMFATMFIPGVGEGGILAEVLSGLDRLLSVALGRLAEGVGTIGRFTVKLAEGAGRAAGSVARLANVTLKIDAGAVKLVDGIAIIDGSAYDVEAVGLKLVGAAEDFANGTIHVEGGVVKIEDGVAKLENATVKVDKHEGPEVPGSCKLSGLALTEEPCIGDQPNGSWVGDENGQRLRLGKPYNDEAKRAIYLANANEPEISPKIRAISDGIAEAKREGWKFRLKKADSLKRKIFDELSQAPNSSPSEVVRSVKDNIRYTMTFESGDYVRGVQKAMEAMAAKGFKLDKFKNYWADTSKSYKGVNSVWFDPDTNQYFELQFHTPESFWLNKAEHPIYEIARTPGMAEEDVTFWTEIAKAMWGEVDTPQRCRSPELSRDGGPGSIGAPW